MNRPRRIELSCFLLLLASLLLLVWGVRADDRFTLGAGVLAGLCTAFVWRAERAADP